jgi:hypothetical protein
MTFPLLSWDRMRKKSGGGAGIEPPTQGFSRCVSWIYPTQQWTATGSCCGAIFVMVLILNAHNKRAGTEPILTLLKTQIFIRIGTAQPRHTQGTEACSKSAMTIGSIAGI